MWRHLAVAKEKRQKIAYARVSVCGKAVSISDTSCFLASVCVRKISAPSPPTAAIRPWKFVGRYVRAGKFGAEARLRWVSTGLRKTAVGQSPNCGKLLETYPESSYFYGKIRYRNFSSIGGLRIVRRKLESWCEKEDSGKRSQNWEKRKLGKGHRF